MDAMKKFYRAKTITYERINGAEVTINKELDGWHLTCYYPQDDYMSVDEWYPTLEAVLEQILDWEKEKLDNLVDMFTGWGSIILPGRDTIRNTIISKMVIAAKCTMLDALEDHVSFDYEGIHSYYVIHRVEMDDTYTWYYEETNANEETFCSQEYTSLAALFATIAANEKESLDNEQKMLNTWVTFPTYTIEQIQEIIVGKITEKLSSDN